MKDDIKTITDDEAKAILDLEPTTFVFKGETERNAGLIAEDTYKVLPQVVKVPEGYDMEDEESEQEGIPGIDYSQITPYLIKMIQVQQKQIDELTEKVNSLISQ